MPLLLPYTGVKVATIVCFTWACWKMTVDSVPAFSWRSGYFWLTILAAFVFCAGLLRATGAVSFASRPVSKLAAVLHCFDDVRSTETRTQHGALPSDVLYVTPQGSVTIGSSEQPQYDIVSGAMFQLSEVDFLRCDLVNQSGRQFTNVKVTFQSTFVPLVAGTHTYALGGHDVSAVEDILSSGKTFDFAIANFGTSIEMLRAANLSANGVSEPLADFLPSDPFSQALLQGSYYLLPQRRKNAPWIFYGRCHYFYPGSAPSLRDVISLFQRWQWQFIHHPPPGCSASDIRAAKTRADKELRAQQQ